MCIFTYLLISSPHIHQNNPEISSHLHRGVAYTDVCTVKRLPEHLRFVHFVAHKFYGNRRNICKQILNSNDIQGEVGEVHRYLQLT